ncbi:unnamed protein product [Malus baccata var. baccata]
MCGSSFLKTVCAISYNKVANPTLVSHLSNLQLSNPLSAGWVKINVDGSFISGSNMGSVGGVFRGEVGSYAGGFVCFVHRSANTATHGMAKLALSFLFEFYWFEKPPNLIVEALVDVG